MRLGLTRVLKVLRDLRVTKVPNKRPNTNMKLNILLCDEFPDYLPDYIPSYVSMFTKLFDSLGEPMAYTVFRTLEGELPSIKTIDNDAVYLIPGCNLGAYDDIGWIKALIDWTRKAFDKGARLMGVCFGHQLIAQALGGKVEKSSKGWGIGMRESTVVDSEGSIYFADGKLRLLYNHHDQVVKMPMGATLISTSDFCPIESYRIGNQVMCFQGHPEYIPEYERHLLTHFTAGEPLDTCKRAMESLNGEPHQGAIVARWIRNVMAGKL